MENSIQSKYFSFSIKHPQDVGFSDKAKGLNQKGQSLVLMVVTLPTFLLFLTLSLLVFKFLIFKEESQSICRKGMLSTQNIQLDGIRNLFKLNPQAKNLRAQRALAEINYKIAIKSKNPKLITAAWLYLKKVQAEQKVFGLIQISLINSYEAQSYLELINTQQEIKRLHFIKSEVINLGEIPMAIKKVPRNSPTPDYVFRSQFSKKQSKGLQWTLTFYDPFPPVTLSCNATIYKEEEPWRSVLSPMDKL